MAKRRTKYKNTKRDELINSDTDANVYLANRDIREKVKLFKLERAVNKDYNQILQELGSLNMSVEEIATLSNIPKMRLKKWLDKGKEDLEKDLDSMEREMYVSYQYGLKSLEGSATLQLMTKHPDKLLSVLNPEKYSDDVTDRFEIPNIIVNVTDKEENISKEKKGEQTNE